jgi:hypothetical protein
MFVFAHHVGNQLNGEGIPLQRISDKAVIDCVNSLRYKFFDKEIDFLFFEHNPGVKKIEYIYLQPGIIKIRSNHNGKDSRGYDIKSINKILKQYKLSEKLKRIY